MISKLAFLLWVQGLFAICFADALSTITVHGFGEPCDAEEQCKSGRLGKYSDCLPKDDAYSTGKACSCVKGATYEPAEGICYPVLKLGFGDDCVTDAQCTADLGSLGRCNEGKCDCNDDGVVNAARDYCLEKADMIGFLCTETQQCNATLGPLSECSDKFGGLICVCNSRAVVKQDWSYCLELVDELGKDCEEYMQCQWGIPGEHSDCLEEKCQCAPDSTHEPGENVCLLSALNVGGPCVGNSQCTANLGDLSECSAEGKCHCIPGSAANMDGNANTKCVLKGVLAGKPCNDTAQCPGVPGQSSTCTKGTERLCGCLSGYTESMKMDDCLVIRKEIGDECSEPQQCQLGTPGRYSECITSDEYFGGCSCIPTAITEPGRHHCYLKATHVNDTCEVNMQCVANLEYSLCLDGRCECLQNSIPSEDYTKCILK